MERGCIMEVFNVVVGVFSIIGAIVSIVSLFYVKEITKNINTSGHNNKTASQAVSGECNKSNIFMR